MNDAVGLLCTNCGATWDQPVTPGATLETQMEFEEPVGVLLADRWLHCPDCQRRHGVLIRGVEQPQHPDQTDDVAVTDLPTGEHWYTSKDKPGDRFATMDIILSGVIGSTLLFVVVTLLLDDYGLRLVAFILFVFTWLAGGAIWALVKRHVYNTTQFGVPK